MKFILIHCTAWLMATSAFAGAPLHVDPAAPSFIRIGEHVAARMSDPIVDETARVITAVNGFTVAGPNVRKEFAVFDDRLEFTYDFALDHPHGNALVIFLPLPEEATARITHGRTYPAPPKHLTVRSGEETAERSNYDPTRSIVGPAPPADAAAGALFPLRYVSIEAPGYALSVDVHPAGACSEEPSYAEMPLRMFAVTPFADGIRISAAIPAGYSGYPGRIKGKIIFYADGRSFEQVHPFAYADEYGRLEKALQLDFSPRPQRRRDDPRVFATETYDAQRGHGWLSDPAALILNSTSLDAVIHGSYITSEQPGRFRLDLPPGYYFLTLNFGNADGATGPMRVTVNGELRLPSVRLDSGRFRNEAVLITTHDGIISIELEGLDGAAWLLCGLSVDVLGTLNEDFIFTRPWWHFAHD